MVIEILYFTFVNQLIHKIYYPYVRYFKNFMIHHAAKVKTYHNIEV